MRKRFVSPDGRAIARMSDATYERDDGYGRDSAVTVYRKVGGECRESVLGVLGMPHVWGLSAAGVALARDVAGWAVRASRRGG